MELRNPLSRFQLDALRPRPLVIEISDSDYPGPILLGRVPEGYIVRETIVEIIESFNDGVGITVGDPVAHARLQAIGDNHPTVEDYYNVNNCYQYDAATNLFVYFPTGIPTKGYARVIVYLN